VGRSLVFIRYIEGPVLLVEEMRNTRMKTSDLPTCSLSTIFQLNFATIPTVWYDVWYDCVVRLYLNIKIILSILFYPLIRFQVQGST
jgi:hypothetical protein